MLLGILYVDKESLYPQYHLKLPEMVTEADIQLPVWMDTANFKYIIVRVNKKRYQLIKAPNPEMLKGYTFNEINKLLLNASK